MTSFVLLFVFDRLNNQYRTSGFRYTNSWRRSVDLRQGAIFFLSGALTTLTSHILLFVVTLWQHEWLQSVFRRPRPNSSVVYVSIVQAYGDDTWGMEMSDSRKNILLIRQEEQYSQLNNEHCATFSKPTLHAASQGHSSILFISNASSKSYLFVYFRARRKSIIQRSYKQVIRLVKKNYKGKHHLINELNGSSVSSWNLESGNRINVFHTCDMLTNHHANTFLSDNTKLGCQVSVLLWRPMVIILKLIMFGRPSELPGSTYKPHHQARPVVRD